MLGLTHTRTITTRCNIGLQTLRPKIFVAYQKDYLVCVQPRSQMAKLWMQFSDYITFSQLISIWNMTLSNLLVRVRRQFRTRNYNVDIKNFGFTRVCMVCMFILKLHTRNNGCPQTWLSDCSSVHFQLAKIWWTYDNSTDNSYTFIISKTTWNELVIIVIP